MARHVLVIPSWYPSEYNPANGGFFRDQCLALHAAGLRVGVIYPELRRLRTFSLKSLRANHFQTEWTDDDGIATLRFQGWNVPGRIQSTLWRRHALRLFDRYVERCGRPDIVHAHGAQAAGSAASLIKLERDCPYVLTEHSSAFARGLFADWQHPLLRSAFADADRVAAVSRALAETIGPWLDGRSDEVEIIPNLVDTDFFDLPAVPPPAVPFRITCVALLNANKQVDVLLRAFERAFPTGSDVLLEIGGDGPERGRLESLCRELGVADRVVFLGLLSRVEVRAVMQRSHVFVLPSAKETFGLVCVEALACGSRVIATRSGGPEEIVTPDVGLLVEPGDVDALSAALRTAHERGPAGRDEALALRASATRRFGAESIVLRLQAMYEQVLARAERT